MELRDKVVDGQRPAGVIVKHHPTLIRMRIGSHRDTVHQVNYAPSLRMSKPGTCDHLTAPSRDGRLGQSRKLQLRPEPAIDKIQHCALRLHAVEEGTKAATL